MSHHRFQLPRSDGSWLIDPAADAWTALVDANHALLSQADMDCQGRSLIQLRQLTQRFVGQAAAKYTSELLGHDVPAVHAQQWVVTGHQPELFHPGVWVKNFAVHRLARQTQAVGLNLIVEHDTHEGTAITVPCGDRSSPRLATVPFDDARPVCPWEELPLANRGLFDRFAGQVADALQPWGISPLLTEAWPIAQRYAARTARPRLCDCLSALRAGVERRWGAGTLELPTSRLATSPGFLWFTSHILAQLPRFLPLYNSIVQDYRRHHRLRSLTHPVPDLAVQDEWQEAPFWVWRARDDHRDRLFARQVGQELWLRDRRDVFLKLTLTPDRSACCAVEQLATLPSRGIRLRSRALTTTLFARLFLADLFVHGIGGAKYDEMTDELIVRLYGLPVANYATISATVHLPLGGPFEVSPQDIGEETHRLWRLEHEPELFCAELPNDMRRLVEEKRTLIAEQQASECSVVGARTLQNRERNRQRYLRLREISRRLSPFVEPARLQLLSHRQELVSQRAANRILQNREFAWVLFPEERLRSFLETMPLAAATKTV